MSFTNKTPNYELPQWLADDKPTFLSDMNGAFSDIDTAMKANENAAASAQSTADANTLSINGITTDLDGAGGVKARLSAVETAESNLEGSVNTINSLIGNGTPTTTDQTIIGAINEIVGFTGEGPLDTTAQTVTGAINELAAGGNVGALDDLSDVEITTPANGDALVYDSANQKWINRAGGAGGLAIDYNHSVQVTADGTKTYAQLITELYTALNAAITGHSYIQIRTITIGAELTFCNLPILSTSDPVRISGYGITSNAFYAVVVSSTPHYRRYDGSTVTELDATAPAADSILKLEFTLFD